MCWRQTHRCALRRPPLAVPSAPHAAAAPPAHLAPTADEPVHRHSALYAWALLLARIDAGAEMRIIAFVTDARTIHDILVHLGEPTAPPRIAPARGPPL